MSSKISDFFKIKPKLIQNQEILTSFINIKNEKEANFVINLEQIGHKNSSNNPAEVVENRPELKEIKQETNEEEINKSKESKIKSKSTNKATKKDSQKPTSNTILSTQIQCQFCSKLLFYHSAIKHVKSHHPDRVEELQNYCELCNEILISRFSLKLHMTKVHPELSEENQFQCDLDGKIFKTKAKIRNHMIYHQKRVQCDFCQIKVMPHIMQRHILRVHNNERKFQCQFCHKSFKLKCSLKDHVRNHDKSFECIICFRKFSSQRSLNIHKKQLHENPGSFGCEICGKKFNRKVHFKTHQRIHDKNRPKPYKCQRCDYATDTNRNYKAHLVFHENQDKKFAAMKNPLKCQKCPTFCSDKYRLNYHMKTVHPKNKFQCDLCGKYLKAKSDLSRHVINKTCRKYKAFKGN